MKKVPINSAFAFIFWEDKILLFHRDDIPTIPNPDCWALPGGGMEIGESPINCLKRELKEEINYAPRNLKFVGNAFRTDGTTHLYVAFVSEMEAKMFKHVGEEGQEIKFFKYKNILKLKLASGLRKGIKKYKEQLSNAIKDKNVDKIKFAYYR